MGKGVMIYRGDQTQRTLRAVKTQRPSVVWASSTDHYMDFLSCLVFRSLRLLWWHFSFRIPLLLSRLTVKISISTRVVLMRVSYQGTSSSASSIPIVSSLGEKSLPRDMVQQDSERKGGWVTNRDQPPTDSAAFLTMTKDRKIAMVSSNGSSIWLQMPLTSPTAPWPCFRIQAIWFLDKKMGSIGSYRQLWFM